MAPEIDPTSVVLFAAGSVAIALLLCVALRRHKRGDSAIKWLLLANIALFAAALGVLLRPMLGFEAATGLVLIGAYLGICFGFFAILTAFSRPLPIVLVTGLGLAGAATHTAAVLSTGTVAALMFSSSLINSILLSHIIVVVWRLARIHGQRMATLLCIPFAALLAGYAIRLVLVVIWGDGPSAIFATVMIIVAMSWAAVILELGMITLREMQARLRIKDALDRANKASAARTQFLLTISHDLRTPLNGILGLAELMRAQALGPLPDVYHEHADEIHRSGTDLLETVSDLLVVASTVEEEVANNKPQAIVASVDKKFAVTEAPDQRAGAG